MKIVVFSGAGMSAESGIRTFRDSNGLWEDYQVEEVATPQAWKNNPDLVTEFYNQRRKQIIAAEPNEAHVMIAQLESLANVTVITQNIDDLHERAGSNEVLHLHGNIRLAKSTGPQKDKKFYPIEGCELTSKDVCDDGFRLRPHVVWFGEEVPMYDKAAQILSVADVLIVIGTSLQVYPAAGLIHYAYNTRLSYIIDPNANNLTVTPNFKIINASATEGMKSVFQELKKLL